MCHHVDMAIDWDEVVTNEESETETLDTADETDEPAIDSEEPMPDITLPADD